MRYAPTVVRLILVLIGGWVGFISAHMRAYAIRPYTCSVDFGIDWGCVGFIFAHVRAYAIRPYSCSVENEPNNIMTKHRTNRDDADTGMTKGSN